MPPRRFAPLEVALFLPRAARRVCAEGQALGFFLFLIKTTPFGRL